MGHRELLLEGAVACLREKGYARTTARDIVAASGTNLGSIGYRRGATEALLNATVMAAMSRATDESCCTASTPLLSGVLVQWLVDPDRAPTAAALHAVAVDLDIRPKPTSDQRP